MTDHRLPIKGFDFGQPGRSPEALHGPGGTDASCGYWRQFPEKEPGLGADGAERLTSSYQFKEAVDYETGDAALISRQDAEAAIVFAETLLAAVRGVLTAESG